MDPSLHPKFILLLLEQGENSFEGYTRLFLAVAHLATYPDDVLCAFYDASLNTACRARRPKMALERSSPHLWSGHWREMDLRSPPVPGD